MPTRKYLEANVAESQGHIAKQEEIVARLDRQGSVELATQARELLATMHAHLATEMDMLKNVGISCLRLSLTLVHVLQNAYSR